VTYLGDMTTRAQSAQRVAMALQAGHIGTWHYDLRTGAIDRDASLDSMLGADKDPLEHTYEAYLERVHPDDRDSIGQNLSAAIAARSATLAAEHRLLLPDGTLRWVEAKAALSYDADGEAAELVGVLVDITDRRLMEDERADALAAEASATSHASAAERRLAMLASAADLLDAPHDLDEALQQVADLAIKVLADWCTVSLLTEGRIHHAAVAHRDPAMVTRAREVQQQYPQDVDEPTFKHVIGALEPIFVAEFEDRIIDETLPDPEHRAAIREFDISSYMVVPLVAGGQGIGIITLVSSHGRHLEADDVAIAMDLGRRAGAAVEKTRLLADLRETSRVLQASLLPAQLPVIPGVNLSAHYRSGTQGLQIGGDFYDVFRTGPDRWWVALGDVCGKGPGAAALTAAVRYTLRAVAPDSDDPSTVLRRLNELLIKQVGDGEFTSMVLATFRADPDVSPEGSQCHVVLDLASGGHPPALLRDVDGAVGPVGANGTLIGLLDEIDVETVRLELSPGQLLLLYTDGATEARMPGGELLGETALSTLLSNEDGGRRPADTSRRLAESLLALTDGVLRDDLALLTLSVPPAA
jgi:PAS domain S-box-containing protein